MDRRRLRTREKGVEKTRARSPRVGGAIDGMRPHGWRRIQAVRGHDKGLKRASALRASGERPPARPAPPLAWPVQRAASALEYRKCGRAEEPHGRAFPMRTCCGHERGGLKFVEPKLLITRCFS